MEYFLFLFSSGLVMGATYGLVGMGFAIIYKATGIVNFAQGELLMLTAYIAFSIGSSLSLSLIPLMLITIPIAMVLGIVLERVFIRPMLGEPLFSIVMVTIGLAVILRGITIMIWGPDPHEFPTGLSSDVVHIGPVPFYQVQLYGLATLCVVTAAAWAFFRFTRLGIAMRAVAANEGAAMLMGIEVSRIHMIAWAFAAAVASLAGILFASMFKLGPTIWFEGLRSFPAVILGGLDSVLGAALGGLIVGLIENLAQGYLGQGLREIAGFVVIVVILMLRPYGLFGAREIERV